MALIISPLNYLCNVLNISPLCHCLSWRYGTPWVFLHSTEKWTWTRYVTIVTGTGMPSINFRIPWYLQQLVVNLFEVHISWEGYCFCHRTCVCYPSVFIINIAPVSTSATNSLPIHKYYCHGEEDTKFRNKYIWICIIGINWNLFKN